MDGIVILIIRHAEKPAAGPGLSLEGEARAKSYVQYFQNFAVASENLQLDYLIAAANSHESDRPGLTLEPLSQALGLKLNTHIKDKDFPKVVEEVKAKKQHRAFLICWHHGQIPALLSGFGVDPILLLPNASWPDDQFGWVLQLRYDSAGRLILNEARRIEESINQTLGAASRSG